MSQNDFVIANQNGANSRSDVNSALQALASNSSGATAPATTYGLMWWFDTTNDILKIRNEANSAWIDVAVVVSGVWVLLGDDRRLLTAIYDTGGTSTAYTFTTGMGARAVGQRFKIRLHTDATAAFTLNRDATGNVAARIYNSGGTLTQADVPDGRRGCEYDVFDDGTQYILSAERLHRGTAARNLVQLDGSGNLPAVGASLLTSLPAPGYAPADQTITPGGTLLLSHGFSAKPSLVKYKLVCQTAQFGFAVGDEPAIYPVATSDTANDRGFTAIENHSSNTQIKIVFGSASDMMYLNAESSGDVQNLTDANWKLRVEAWK